MLRSAALLASVVLFASACSSADLGQEPKPPTQLPPSTQSAPSDEPTGKKAPAKPKPADPTSIDAAIETAEYFLELHSYAAATGDLEEFNRLSLDSCGFCASFREGVTGVYTSGGRLEGGGLRSAPGNANEPTAGMDGNEVQIVFETEQLARTRLDKHGDIVESQIAKPYFVGVNMLETPNGWRVKSVSGVDR